MTARRVYCDGRCDEMGCRGHDVLSFKDCAERADDKDELMTALFASLEDAVDATDRAMAEIQRDFDSIRFDPTHVNSNTRDAFEWGRFMAIKRVIEILKAQHGGRAS